MPARTLAKTVGPGRSRSDVAPTRADPGVIVQTFDPPLDDTGFQATSFATSAAYGRRIDTLVLTLHANGAATVAPFASGCLMRYAPSSDAPRVKALHDAAAHYIGGIDDDEEAPPPWWRHGDIVSRKSRLLDPLSSARVVLSNGELTLDTTAIVVEMLPPPGKIVGDLFVDARVLIVSPLDASAEERHIDSHLYELRSRDE